MNEAEDEIDLLELARTIWKGKSLIIWIVTLFTLVTAIASLLMTNIYTARVVIKPLDPPRPATRTITLPSQYGGQNMRMTIVMPNSPSSHEIVSLLKSNVLKKEVIEKYDLLPVLFPKSWDEQKKQWKKPKPGPGSILKWLIGKLRPTDPKAVPKEPGVPDIWGGIRALGGIVKIDRNIKEGVITVSADFPDPETSAKIVDYYITTFKESMSSEARRIAMTNKEYLEKQLLETNNAPAQQIIYAQMADEIEAMKMAKNEDFPVKILDPPMTPDRKSKPKRAQMVVLAFIVSLFFGVCAVLFREYLRKIKNQSAAG